MNTQTVFITGATSGIGLATAKHFVDQGKNVLFTGRDEAKVKQTEQQLSELAGTNQITGFVCDNADFDQINSLAAHLTNQQIKIDSLILNAGVFYPAMFADNSQQMMQQTMAINFFGPAIMLQSFIPVLANPCSVVYVSSVAVEKAWPTASVYSASKAAFEGLTGSINLELATQGVRINHLRPGVTLTEIQTKAGMSDEQITELVGNMSGTPMGRILQPEDMIAAIDYLASNASSGMRNAAIRVDGGFCLG
ncbi:SDR family NAD(P)-dependent oxidoreductase [Catenovulum agarivorans]|uniref:SDR family NAD(P)-dependent oxidoreductase n=1 Tax=Catenovulum agarivorans TaxID=1172192 RepID=UPI0002D29F22|nr:SDR family oxidoreductase [Catenovulum agarivorans]